MLAGAVVSPKRSRTVLLYSKRVSRRRGDGPGATAPALHSPANGMVPGVVLLPLPPVPVPVEVVVLPPDGVLPEVDVLPPVVWSPCPSRAGTDLPGACGEECHQKCTSVAALFS